MNIVSSIVGLAIMGPALPMVSNMMIETVVAQKRAENFAVAETSAVSYAASAQDKYTLPDVTNGCELTLIQDRTQRHLHARLKHPKAKCYPCLYPIG